MHVLHVLHVLHVVHILFSPKARTLCMLFLRNFFSPSLQDVRLRILVAFLAIALCMVLLAFFVPAVVNSTGYGEH